MRLIFMGTPDFAVPSLVALAQAGFLPVAVVTGPDKPRGRGQQVSSTPVKQKALELGIHTIIETDSPGSEDLFNQLSDLKPDLMVVVAFRILPERIFSLPPKGTFNLHASLLPRYRGAAPIQWCLINGDRETGVTTFFLQKSVDTGSVIGQKRLPIPETMTGTGLYRSLSELGADLVVESVRHIQEGTVRTVPQDDTLATPARKITKEDSRIRWDEPGEAICNRIRAFEDTPGAWCLLDGKVLKLFQVDFEKRSSYPQPAFGLITGYTDIHIIIAVRDGLLRVRHLQLEGKKRLSVSNFLNGYPLSFPKQIE